MVDKAGSRAAPRVDMPEKYKASWGGGAEESNVIMHEGPEVSESKGRRGRG